MNDSFMVCLIFVLYFSFLNCQQVIHQEVYYKDVKCLVCRQLMGDIVNAVSKVSPHITVNVGGYFLDGNEKQQSIEYRKSEGYLTEVMEQICVKMDDYVKVKHRYTGEIMVIPLLNDGGQMNKLMSDVDVVQDENLNKNLRLYCDEIVDEFNDIIIGKIQENLDTAIFDVCDMMCEVMVVKGRNEL